MKVLRSVKVTVTAPFSGGHVLLKIGEHQLTDRIFLQGPLPLRGGRGLPSEANLP